MAVVLIVELGESPQLDLDLNTLQFVGIADHSQLKNRDLAEQHPISAITGLTEKHSAYDQTLGEHSLALAELDEFQHNIATQTDIEEVLDHE